MQPIADVVAKTSPNLYAAAKQANLDPTQLTQVEQMSYAIEQHKKLNAMDKAQAKIAYGKLDTGVQQGLKFLFKDADYAKPDPSLGEEAIGALKFVGKTLASPLIGVFKLAGAYNRVINTPYLVAREVGQGDGSVFNTKIWKKAWDGNAIFDNNALKEAEKVFSKSDLEVAKGLLTGKTPGEILSDQNKVDKDMLESIKKAYNKPEEFRQVMDAVKYAQVSPGRDLARMMDDVNVYKNGGLHGDYVSSSTKNISGVVDFTYQILIDPLTWLTGGSNKAATIGERLATSIEEAAKAGNLKGGVKEAIAHPRVFKLWEEQLGPMIERYSLADKKPIKGEDGQALNSLRLGSAAAKSAVFREISRKFPGYANREIIEKLAEAKVFNAKSAENYFSNAENTHLMLSGRVDGVTYARNGVAVARSNRYLADGLTTYLDSIFNATTSKSLGKLSTKGRTLEEVDAKGGKIAEALIKTGESVNGLVGYNPEVLKVVEEANGEIGKLKKFGYWVGKQAARSPAGLEILIGANAERTANNFTMVARQLLPRDMAEYMTTRFLASTPDEQVVILRNLYAGIMLKFGLNGEAKGRELMNSILRDKFGGQAGFATMVETGIPEQFAKNMEAHSVKLQNNQLILQTEDAIQPYHSAHAIGSLPYDQIASHVAAIKSQNGLFNAMLGSASGPFAKKAVDAWSMLTLLPRLGIRSAIDEGMMYILTAPGRDLLAYATRQGHKMGKVSTAFTGSKGAVGPIRELIGKVFPKVDPSNALSVEARQKAIIKLAKDLKVPVEDLYNLQKREAIVNEVMKLYGKNLDKDKLGFFLRGLVHNPDMLNSVAQSAVGHSGLSGKYDPTVLRGIITPSALDNLLEKYGLKQGRTERKIDTKELTEHEVIAAHFSKIFKGFVANKVDLTDTREFDPARAFLRHNGLKTEEDFAVAKDKLSVDAGLTKTINGSWIVQDQAAVDAFKAMSARTVEMLNRGLDDADLVRGQIDRILTDLYVTFHGSHTNFNQELLDDMRKSMGFLRRNSKNPDKVTWSQAAAHTLMDDAKFVKLTHGKRPIGEINTDIEFAQLMDVESMWRKFGDKGFEWMDRQITGMHRQAALNVTFAHVSQKWAGIERQFVKDHIDEAIKQNPDRYGKFEAKPEKLDKKYIRARARLQTEMESLGQKRFTEIAMQHAADEMLKYADNPAVRSNFSYSVRTVGRYYRATEDFQRRMYRMKEVPLRVLYRMRLANLGLSASGAVYTDSNGMPYVMLPMDNVLFKATDSTLRTLTGQTGYSQPMFSDLTLKLNMVNPSFQQDSGLPMLSGPIAGLGVIAMKNLLGYTNNATAIKTGNVISNAALGNFGTNTNLQKALIPSSLQRIWDMLPVNEQTRQEVTAAQQAMAYNAANGVHLDANASDQEKAAYLKNLRISAHNIIFMRSLLGLMAPAAPTLQESKTVPDYLLKVGVTGLRAEFFDILNGITKADRSGDVTDPYEQALVTFIGQNPGKLIYTVSRDAKQTRVVVRNTQELNNWVLNNKKAIDTYGEAAYVLAPQVGKFNAASYNFIQAAGLVKNKSLEQYYTDLLTAQDKQAYYEIGTKEKAALLAEPDVNRRSMIIAEATAARNELKTSNPLLNAALIGEGNNIGNETKLFDSLSRMIIDPTVNMDGATRTRLNAVIAMMKEFIALSTDPYMRNLTNFADLKNESRQRIEEVINGMAIGDPSVAEANRAIFSSILKFYSRDAYVAFKKGF